MARIRTIKPEFPHSESMGKISREARLLFIQLWTLADDEGRLRAASRMLASLLYPYDDDVPALIDGWLFELEREQCIRRYAVDGAHYLEIANWLDHQKIDKPSKSKLPPFDEGSRIVAKPRERSSADLDQEGNGREGKKDAAPVARIDLADNDEKALYDRGRDVLGPSAGGMVKRLLLVKGGNIALARAAIETASTKSRPREYIGGVLKDPGKLPPEVSFKVKLAEYDDFYRGIQ